VGRPVRVVVGIATHNRADILRKAIRSALDQAYRPIRVAVIDDASTDQTPSVRKEFPNISWERFNTAQGYVSVRNRIMLDATEDYYVSLDDDAWFLKGDEIAIAVRHLQTYSSVGAIAFDILSPEQPQERRRDVPKNVGMFIGCGHALRLSVVKELGGYAEFPGTYGCEEVDLCLRMIDAGYEIAKLPGVHVWHDKTRCARDIMRQYQSGVCNDLAVALRRVPLLILIPTLIWKITQQLLFAFKTRRVVLCVHGFADFLRATPALWRSRKVIRLASVARSRVLSRARHV
jgi:GT2 family glycosyltransferase